MGAVVWVRQVGANGGPPTGDLDIAAWESAAAVVQNAAARLTALPEIAKAIRSLRLALDPLKVLPAS